MKLTAYKKIFRDRKISTRMVAIYVGRTRETVCLWLNGKMVPPIITDEHIKLEFIRLLLEDDKFLNRLRRRKNGYYVSLKK